MKSRAFGILVLIFSLAAFAGSVPQVELNNVNQFIGSILGDFGSLVQIEVTKATRSNQTKLLTSASVEANILGALKVELGLKTKRKKLIFSGSLEGKTADLGMEVDDLLGMVTEAKKFVDAINKKGDYVAIFEMKGNEEGTNLSLTMKPSKANKKPSVKKLTMKGFLPNDANETARVSITGTFNGGADNVKIVRTSVTNIFNSLAAEEIPSEDDFAALGKVIETMLKALEDLEE